jgi:hypothetical protein
MGRLAVCETAAMGPVLEVRLPRRTRVVVSVYFGVLTALALGFAIVALVRVPAATPVPLAVAALLATAGYRWTWLAVVAEGDTLNVRNLLRSQRLPRRSIEAFRIGGSLWSTFKGNRAIQAVLTSGESVPLDVTVQSLHLRRRDDQEVYRSRLEAWLLAE